MSTNIILTIIGSSALFSFVEYLITRHDRKQDDPIKAAVRSLLRDRIKCLATRYLRDGELTAADLENLSMLYEAYKNLGGNSFAEDLYNQVIDVCRLK